MGVQGPDNIPQRDSISVNRNGEVSTNRAEQFKENARNMFIEAFAKLKTSVKPETEAEAREAASLPDEEKLLLLVKTLEIYISNKDRLGELSKGRIEELEIEIAELKTRIEAQENLKKPLEDINNEEVPE